MDGAAGFMVARYSISPAPEAAKTGWESDPHIFFFVRGAGTFVCLLVAAHPTTRDKTMVNIQTALPWKFMIAPYRKNLYLANRTQI